MNTQTAYPQKPNRVNVIGWMTLASGVVNIVWGLAASGMAFATIVGIICTPLTILPSILGIFEILYAAKLLSNPPQPLRPNTTIALLEIVCVLIGNVFAHTPEGAALAVRLQSWEGRDREPRMVVGGGKAEEGKISMSTAG